MMNGIIMLFVKYLFLFNFKNNIKFYKIYYIERSGLYVYVYLDGQFYSKIKGECKIESENPMCIGSFCAGEYQLNGSLKEFRIYNKVLEQHEI